VRAIFYTMTFSKAHTHPAALNLAQSTHPDGIVVVSGSTSELPRGGAEGREGAPADAPPTGSFSECVRHLHESGGAADPSAALLAGSLHPAKLLGLEHKGRLSQGADADLVLLDDTLHVRGCFVGGQLAWAHASLHGALWWHR
jgi:N-acetylglucosamine-6-phosphate deacetylase